MKKRMTFADQLRELREAKAYSRQDLADELDVSLQSIINWERGDRTPPFPMVQALCKALGVKCTVFDGCEFGEAEDKPGRGRPRKD
jgi:transcriptional regulator with XRE-family HTH domain